MKLFGGKKKAPQAKESIAKLRETIDMLEKREQFLQKKIDKETSDAKKNMQLKNKRAALMCLKRKKTYESQLDKLSGARMTIEQQVMTLEGANVSLEAMNAMKMGATSMKAIHKNMKVEDVDNIMDDIRDQMDVANEINDAISQPLGTEIMDEDELLSELEGLEQESLDEQLLSLGPSPQTNKLPSAPTKVPAKKVVDEEAELAALEASMV